MKTYESALTENSDIVKHLPTLKRYAMDCDTITEIGLGQGNSTVAFMAAEPFKITTIEIDPNWAPALKTELKQYALHLGVQHSITYSDSTQIADPSAFACDFLFIDGDHSYLTVKKELEMYAQHARKYIGFHDIVTFGYRNMVVKPGQDKHGINWAIEEFLETNPNWKIDHVNIFNNGLLILKKD